jgi:hypothetical protein
MPERPAGHQRLSPDRRLSLGLATLVAAFAAAGPDTLHDPVLLAHRISASLRVGAVMLALALLISLPVRPHPNPAPSVQWPAETPLSPPRPATSAGPTARLAAMGHSELPAPTYLRAARLLCRLHEQHPRQAPPVPLLREKRGLVARFAAAKARASGGTGSPRGDVLARDCRRPAPRRRRLVRFVTRHAARLHCISPIRSSATIRQNASGSSSIGSRSSTGCRKSIAATRSRPLRHTEGCVRGGGLKTRLILGGRAGVRVSA